jgi:hypothetical protein
LQGFKVHPAVPIPSDIIDACAELTARLASMSSPGVLTADDIPDDDDTPPGSLPFDHWPSVCVVHMHRERV